MVRVLGLGLGLAVRVRAELGFEKDCDITPPIALHGITGP